MKDLYTANYKTLIKEINKDINNRKGIPHSWIGKINFVNMFNSTQSNVQIQCNSIKILMVFFHRNRANSPHKQKFIWNHKRP